MSVRLDDTTAGEVSSAINRERFLQGSSAVNRVLTLVIVADEETQADAVVAAAEAAREHPCRILTAIPRPGRTDPRLDAVITVGGGDGLGELVELRLRGHLSEHIASVVLPLLVPDSPVVVWWPGKAPASPSEDPVGRLAQRRITDAAACPAPAQGAGGAPYELRRRRHRPRLDAPHTVAGPAGGQPRPAARPHHQLHGRGGAEQPVGHPAGRLAA